MKLSKNSLIPVLALALFLAWPLTAALAAPETLDSTGLEKLESLHDQLWAKGVELEALQQAGNVQETKAVAAEMNKLKAQIRDERRRLGVPAGRPGGPPGGPGGRKDGPGGWKDGRGKGWREGRGNGWCDCPGR